MSGARKSFQAYTTWKIATAMIAGQAWGTMTDTSVRAGLAPSIAAASSISRGMVSRYWRRRNTSYAFAKNDGTSSGSQEPTQPSFRNTVYVGMSVTTYGRKMVAMRSVNIRLRPGNRKRANPYATTVHERIVPTIVMRAMAAVLNSRRG